MDTGRRRLVVAIAAFAALAAWVWPSVARSSTRLDVVVVGAGAVVEARDEIGRHVREHGQSVEVAAVDPCDLDALEAQLGRAPVRIVSWPAASAESCAESLAGILARRGATVVTQDEPLVAGAVDATWLVPPGPGATTTCQWWEPPAPAAAIANCDPDGTITLRDANGALTAAGRDRFARVVAGTLR